MQSIFAQLENYPITDVGIINNDDINFYSNNNYLTVPEGKVWKVISGENIIVRKPNEDGFMIAHKIGTSSAGSYRNYMVIPSGYEVYSSSSEYSFNYIEYDITVQQLSHAEPKIDNRPILYPNPTSSLLALNSDKEYDIEVYDMAGNKVMALTGNTIDMSHLSSATYIVKALDKVENEEVSYTVVKN